MKTYKITISVDVKQLLESTDAHESEESIETLIEKEFGWLQRSGIFLSKIEEDKN